MLCELSTCQHRHSRNLRTSIPLYFIVSDSDLQISLLTLLSPIAGKTKKGVIPSRFFQSIHGNIDDST